MNKRNYFIILFFVCLNIKGQTDYPILSKICTDKAALFSQHETENLIGKLTAYETKTTHQIVVLTINDLGNDTVENYALKVFNNNGLGNKKLDNGLLILIAKNDRKFRIEVGDGLLPIITDAFSSRVIRNIMTPQFKKGDFYKGVDLATSEIIKLIDDPEYRDEFQDLVDNENKMPIGVMLFFALFIGVFICLFIWLGYILSSMGYEAIINLFIGLITGKVSIVSFPIIFFQSLFFVIFGFIISIVPATAAILAILHFVFKIDLKNLWNTIIDSGFLTLNIVIAFLVLVFIVIPLSIAFLRRSKKQYEPIKLSLFKNNKSYMSQHFTSSGSSSSYSGSSGSRSSFGSSSSSSSSFSGGGGSSSGGGASGSW